MPSFRSVRPPRHQQRERTRPDVGAVCDGVDQLLAAGRLVGHDQNVAGAHRAHPVLLFELLASTLRTPATPNASRVLGTPAWLAGLSLVFVPLGVSRYRGPE